MTRFLLPFLAALLFVLPLHADEVAPEDLEVFYELVAVGPTVAVKASLTENPALATARDPDGFEAIHMLDQNGFADKLKLLLASGAGINARTNDGIGLIHILPDAEFLPVLLAAGADINLRDTQDRTPLMLFAQDPEAEDMLRALIDAGADATLRDKDGYSAWHYARDAGQDDAVLDLLTKAGAAD